jgi:hypothetical protein
VDKFTTAYIECALWAETDNDTPLDENYGVEDIAPETLVLMKEDCRIFQYQNRLPEYHSQWSDEEMAGHDFWLTRNGHGVGFWDRGLGEVGDRLTEASKRFGEVYLYVGDDGLIWS